MRREDVRKAARKLRYRIGRFLVRHEATRIINHYSMQARNAHDVMDDRRGERCEYIALGARYVRDGWPG